MAEQKEIAPQEEVGSSTNVDKAVADNRKNVRAARKAPEDIFDLTKPIPRVEKPMKEKHDAQIAAINEEIDSLKDDKKIIQDKIDSEMDGNRNSAVGKEREALKVLRDKKGALIDQKKAMRERFNTTRNQSDRLRDARKVTKSNIRFSDVGTINAELEKLRRRQETTSMSLSEEKRLIKEMDALQASKSHVAELNVKDANIDDVMKQSKVIKSDINAKDKEIDAVQVEVEAQMKKLDALRGVEGEARNLKKTMFSERDAFKEKIGAKMDERSALRKEFNADNDKWYDYQRAVKAQRQIRFEEEKKVIEEEKKAWLKEKEDEEAKKIPYEEEMALCDYLADYLTRTYLSEKKSATEEKKDDKAVTLKDDPFAGFKPVGKKQDEVFLKMGAAKKPRTRVSKKKPKAAFTLSVDSFEQFGLLSLIPPTSRDTVEGSVAELRAKKKFYSEQPRGSVQTAQDIRKANEKTQAKNRQGGNQKKAVSQKGRNGKIDLTSDEFAPLSTTSSTTLTVNATWGNRAAEPKFDAGPNEQIFDDEPELETELDMGAN